MAVDRDTILAQYFENGFPNATFEWNSTPAASRNQIDLRYVVREGRQQFVRAVLITGTAVTRTQLINRNITLNPGDPLSPTEMTDIQRRLYGLGVFARVDTAIQNPEGETDRKYVLYNMEEARRYSMAVGFGAELGRIGGCQTCFDAPAGTTGFSPRVSFDIARNNLWGLAHTLSLRTRVSTLDQRGLLNYSWPRFRSNENLTVSFTGLYQHRSDVRTFNFDARGRLGPVHQRLTKATTFFYRYTYRRVGVSDPQDHAVSGSALSQPVRVGIAVIERWCRTAATIRSIRIRASTIRSTSGSRNGSSDRSANFLRFLARNATYHQLGKRLVLARSTRVRRHLRVPLHAATALDAIPLPERFFGGGGTSHRGFPGKSGRARATPPPASRWAARRCCSTRPSCASP